MWVGWMLQAVDVCTYTCKLSFKKGLKYGNQHVIKQTQNFLKNSWNCCASTVSWKYNERQLYSQATLQVIILRLKLFSWYCSRVSLNCYKHTCTSCKSMSHCRLHWFNFSTHVHCSIFIIFQLIIAIIWMFLLDVSSMTSSLQRYFKKTWSSSYPFTITCWFCLFRMWLRCKLIWLQTITDTCRVMLWFQF